MKRAVLCAGLVAVVTGLASTRPSLAQSSAAFGSEWSKSGFSGALKYKCKQPSCGGKKSAMHVRNFGQTSGAPQLGIPEGSNLEAEFRRRPEVRRILAGMLQQLTREGPNKGSKITTGFFTKSNHVGVNLTVFSPKENLHLAAQLIIEGNKALLAGGEAETAERARQNLNLLLPTLPLD
jgi:hypothetical protein